MEEVNKVIGRPTFTKVHKVIVAIKSNCIAMDNPRSRVGKLHCICNSQHLEAEGVGVPASRNPGPPTFVGLDDLAARDNYIIDHTQLQAQWQSDVNVKEACKRFLISRFEPVYFQELADPLTKFKGVSVRDMITHLNTKYPAEPEEVELQEAILRQEWDANNHIENLFQSVKEGVETLLAMEAIDNTEMDKIFIKYAYSAIRGSGQFESACIKWKAKAEIYRETTAQIRAYFNSKYDIFDAEQNSLHQAGVANSVQLQEILQATNDNLINIRDRQDTQDTINTTLLNFAKTKSSDVDDTATTMSAITAHSAIQDQQRRRIDELEALIRSNNITNNNNNPRSDVSTSGGSRKSKSTSNNRGKTKYRPISDGPPNSTKNGPFYANNDNYCWTHGYDIAGKHDSKSCTWREIGHQETATGDNPMGGSVKDKEFSKWK